MAAFMYFSVGVCGAASATGMEPNVPGNASKCHQTRGATVVIGP